MNLSESKIKILETLAIVGARSRDTIAKFTRIPRTTVYDNLIQLERRGYVKSYYKKVEKHEVGRPRTMWEIDI